MDRDEFLKKVKVVSDDDAEKCDFLVCVRADTPSYFDDDLFGFCCKCGVKVRYRWHAPRTPKRICMECVVKQKENEWRA